MAQKGRWIVMAEERCRDCGANFIYLDARVYIPPFKLCKSCARQAAINACFIEGPPIIERTAAKQEDNASGQSNNGEGKDGKKR